LEQQFDEDTLYALRSAVAAHANHLGLPADRVADLVVVAHELASNSVRHGGGAGRLRLWQAEHVVYCEVSDAGPGLSDPALAGRRKVPTEAIGGRGLWIIRQLADTFDIRTGSAGSVMTAGFVLADHGPADPEPATGGGLVSPA
jgi:anti-sigma regulatory factor (Ser/Thr protein kinase)